MSKRILIADDNESVLRAVRVSLEFNPAWEICGEAINGVEAVAKAVELDPDIIILDLAMPRMDGLDAAEEIHRLMPSIPIIIHTLYRSALDLTNMESARSWTRQKPEPCSRRLKSFERGSAIAVGSPQRNFGDLALILRHERTSRLPDDLHEKMDDIAVLRLSQSRKSAF